MKGGEEEFIKEEGMVDGIEGFAKVDGEEGGTIMGFIQVEATLDLKGDGKKSSRGGVKGFEAMLIGVLGEGIEERGYKKFKEFHFMAEDGDGTVR